MKPAIRVEDLSKCYQISPHQAGYRTLRESIMTAVAAPARKLRRWLGADSPEPESGERTHWALRDVNFEVRPGEVIGLIGRNGAGKSTLLKLLSRITEPTSGRVELRGRVLSLLEIGTGFHQELTGRENIYLNGAILGMTRREIERKFDDIVAFAEIEKFLDTPSKRYSSGMYIRLAFAVAAQFEAEVLLVDEVLAVGDAAFQKKCLDRIAALARSGGTVIFVSHNMGTVTSICQTALVLDGGRLIARGEAREQARLYLNLLGERSAVDLAGRTDRGGNGVARLSDVRLLDSQGRSVEHALGGEPLTIRLGYRAERPLASAEVHVWLCNEQGQNATMLSNRFSGDPLETLPAVGALECHIPEVVLAPGGYLLNIDLFAGSDLADSVQGAARLDVAGGPFFASGRTPGAENGIALTRHSWSLQRRTEAASGRDGR
jgi:lipopolysaccharide transport system ATP-binding protein